MTALIKLLGHSAAVVDHDSQLVFTRGETFRKVKYLWSGDVITASCELAVYIDLRWFGAL